MRAIHKVLVVDDDPVVGKSFNRVLSNKGYAVITAANAHEALTKLKEGGFDAVFTDIRMPGMDGLELAERVKARTPWTPVVIITGEKDYRVPYTQSLEAFTVAQTKGIPSKLIIYPNENHWVLHPQEQIVWFREFFTFLDTYCGAK